MPPAVLTEVRRQQARASLTNCSPARAHLLWRLSSDSPDEPFHGNASPSVLVVEDEGIVALVLRRKLASWGYLAPEYAVTGEEAVERALRARPDLILMDIGLRGPMDGITAAAQIQREADIPVIYITAYGDEETVRRASETRHFGFLHKPVDDEVLRRAIEEALHGYPK